MAASNTDSVQTTSMNSERRQLTTPKYIVFAQLLYSDKQCLWHCIYILLEIFR